MEAETREKSVEKKEGREEQCSEVYICVYKSVLKETHTHTHTHTLFSPCPLLHALYILFFPRPSFFKMLGRRRPPPAGAGSVAANARRPRSHQAPSRVDASLAPSSRCTTTPSPMACTRIADTTRE